MEPIIVGVTVDVAVLEGRERFTCSPSYVEAIVQAGGTPVLLAPGVDAAAAAARCDAIVLTGGDDPRMEAYGAATHPKATPVDPRRQAFEEALLAHLAGAAPDLPVLGVCLGMQMMGLVAGGGLDQHMPETCDAAGRHWDGVHEVVVTEVLGASGPVFSRHRQCLTDGGSMRVIGTSDDGVIEAIADADRRFYVGVQWHPERTEGPLGTAPFRLLMEAARGAAVSR